MDREELVALLKRQSQTWYSEKYCLEAVKQNGHALQYVREQTEAICLEAVKQNGHALPYVNKRVFKN